MKHIIFSDKAYMALLAEVLDNISTETGGILLGHREKNTWYVIESVEPGPNSYFSEVEFEYDDRYVNYRANIISRQYKRPLKLLGLWHRHPGTLNVFSDVDDQTNYSYSTLLKGAISGIVTLGKGFDLTMYYVPEDLAYEPITWEHNQEKIPQHYLAEKEEAFYAKPLHIKNKNNTIRGLLGSRKKGREIITYPCDVIWNGIKEEIEALQSYNGTKYNLKYLSENDIHDVLELKFMDKFSGRLTTYTYHLRLEKNSIVILYPDNSTRIYKKGMFGKEIYYARQTLLKAKKE